MSQGPNKIQIDSDWKAQAQAEKEKIAKQAQAAPAAKQQAPGANFETLISTMIHQALFALGAIPDPRTGQRQVHLELARLQIDMLTVIEDKTKGNLTKEEEELLKTATYELRTRYIQVSSGGRGG
jgi:hypothetical protein